jgi:hypothetical protein
MVEYAHFSMSRSVIRLEKHKERTSLELITFFVENSPRLKKLVLFKHDAVLNFCSFYLFKNTSVFL